MIPRKRIVLPLAVCLIVLTTARSPAQTQTTGRIAGTVKDQNGALIIGAHVKVVNDSTGEQRETATNEDGVYSAAFLPSGRYHVSISATGFSTLTLPASVAITETTKLDADLTVAGPNIVDTFATATAPLLQTDGPQLGRVVDARTLSELPLATRNFTQILGLAPGTSAYLPDDTVVGRNSQNVSVNGARVTQNNIQINGIDANAGISRGVSLANPAPETIQEFTVQTSLYDATFGR